MTWIGRYKNGIPWGRCWQWKEGGGYVTGNQVDIYILLTRQSYLSSNLLHFPSAKQAELLTITNEEWQVINQFLWYAETKSPFNNTIATDRTNTVDMSHLYNRKYGWYAPATGAYALHVPVVTPIFANAKAWHIACFRSVCSYGVVIRKGFLFPHIIKIDYRSGGRQRRAQRERRRLRVSWPGDLPAGKLRQVGHDRGEACARQGKLPIWFCTEAQPTVQSWALGYFWIFSIMTNDIICIFLSNGKLIWLGVCFFFK